MANEVSFGDKLMVSFLRVMVFILIIILIAIPVCILLDFLGVMDALGFS
ncbi:hypothetical protein [Flagellimonas sediminis]|uniref:Uncharacterized protein n=1 Tax=Flagellimonas sediminis TaxID=2696468 RepID=A0A6I5KRZ5_9FLAO|nr:hypothetical protein [Allomuricauda sediminis]NDV43203.1 hypothetical protein [Allomuricauda sediminis]